MRIADILDAAPVYRIWQLPFRRAKLAPVLRQIDFSAVSKTLDVGCGPGTNAGVFMDSDYVGLDINQRYIAYAQQRYQGVFQAADVRDYDPPHGTTFDLILINSFLHHVGDEDAERILVRLERALAANGFVHIVDLVLPERSGIPRWLARHDRGRFARSLEHWRSLFSKAFSPVVFEPFGLSLSGIELWKLVYFKGERKSR